MKTDPPSSRSSRRSASFHGWFSLLIAAVILVFLNILAFKYYYHRDLSTSQFYTLSPKTVDVLTHLDAPVRVTVLFSSRIQQQYSQQIQNLLEEYERVSGKNFTMEKVDPAYNMARASELQKKLQFDGTENLVIFEYKGRTRFVKQDDLYEMNPMTQQVGVFKGEQQFTAALVALIEGKSSKVYFTVGHGEPSIHDSDSPQGVGLIVGGLKNNNVETADLNLASVGDVPADAQAVVVAGPSVSFSPIEVQAIDHYLANNGKVLILLDPYVALGLDELLKRYGLKFNDDIVLCRVASATGEQATEALALINSGGFSAQPVTAKLATSNFDLQLHGARSIAMLTDARNQPNPKVQFLLQTDPNFWGWVRKANTPVPTDPTTLTFNRATDNPGPLTISAVYDGGTVTDPKTQAIIPATRIILVGNSRFLGNAVADVVGQNFFNNCVEWLVKKEARLDVAPKIPQQYGLSLSPMQERTVTWMSLLFIPGAALVWAGFTWLSRRK